jgi:bifunctional UDP-N-acetylglucosamine pyrophosphorylase/glucosamine-1-phosphate N-acetyltransferase
MSPVAENVHAVILAAGQGTRLRSSIPKVLHRAAGRPMLEWVVEAARSAGCDQISVVVGHGAEQVRSAMAGDDLGWVLQKEQKGTGHALAQAAPQVAGGSILLVLSGDVPLVRGQTLEALVDAARNGWGAMAVAELDEPGSLGRVVARSGSTLEAIVEAADASPEELTIRRVNAGLYALPAPAVFEFLDRLEPNNAKGELYLTDALNDAAQQGLPVQLVSLEDPAESFGVNNRADLGRVHRALNRRHAADLMAAGVTLLDPDRTTIEATVRVGSDTIVHPGVTLLGQTSVGEGCVLHQGVWLRDASVDSEVEIAPYSVLEGARIAADCRIGPFARLRPGAVIGPGSKVGNFVEIKNSELDRGVKASHLSYIGDTTIGEGSNIGAGVITCNYDGFDKHSTRIGRRVLIGSDTMLVAPVEIGDESMTGAGSVITRDVPAGALAVERSKQRNIADWARRFRRRKKKKG